MPQVTATPRVMADGSKAVTFVDSVGTAAVNYTFNDFYDALYVRNTGSVDLSVTAAGTTLTVQSGSLQVITGSFAMLSISASSSMGSFEIRAVRSAKPSTYTTKLRPIATRSQPYANTNGDGISDGTELNVTYTTRHTATDDVNELFLGYGNFYTTIAANTEVAGPNAITIGFSVQPVNSNVRIPGRTYGKEYYTLQPDEFSLSDGIKVNAPKGTDFLVHTNVQVDTLGKKWPVGITTYPASGEGKTTGDITRSGNVTTAFLFAYSPLVILGKTDKPATLFSGDSNSFGQGDSPNDYGFLKRAFNAAGIPWLNITKPGDRANWFKQVAQRRNRSILAKYCDNIIFHYGTNDIKQTTNTAAQIISDMQENFAWAKSVGLNVYADTILPCGDAAWDATKESTRVQVNNWIRSMTDPNLSGMIDIADMVEASRNSNVQVANMFIADKIHLSPAGHQLVGSKYPTWLFA